MKSALKWISLVVVAFLSIIIITGLLAPDENPVVPKRDAGTYLTIEDMQIRYRQVGQGPDVLLIHGLPGSIEDFEALMGALSSRYRVTAYDRPGQGYSSAVGAAHTVVHNAHIARQLIQKLDLRDVIVVGHSYGGTTALQLAIEHTAGVRGYVALAAGADSKKEVDPFYPVITTPVIGKGILAISGWAGNAISKAKIKSGLENAFHPNLEWCTDAFVQLRQTLWMQPSVSVAIATEIPAMYRDLLSMQSHYGEITAPVILVQGDGDRSATVAESEYLLKSIPSAKRVLLKDTGHYSQIARTDEVVKAIDEIAAMDVTNGMATLSRYQESAEAK